MDWRSIVDRLAGAMLTEDDYDYFWEYFNAQGVSILAIGSVIPISRIRQRS